MHSCSKRSAVLPQALKLAQLEYILDRAEEAFAAGTPPTYRAVPLLLQSIHSHAPPQPVRVAKRPRIRSSPSTPSSVEDPADVFAQHGRRNPRTAYHMRVAELAAIRRQASEVQTAQIALQPRTRCAAATSDPDPIKNSLSVIRHIGYYLFAEGLPELHASRIGYHPPPIER